VARYRVSRGSRIRRRLRLNLVVPGRWEASRYAYLFVLVPVLTVALSAWLDDEPVGEGLLVGGVLVLVGVHVGALRGQGSGTADP
jgi:drug/metabolite transporter (DMT)-like permease